MKNGESDALRRRILGLVGEYYRATWGVHEPFVPGTSPVHYGGRVFDEDELECLVEAALDFWLTAGRFCARFESELASYVGVRHCILVNSGSSANLLAFAALASVELGERRLEAGDEVITVAAGFPTTVAPIIQCGAVPVFVDVDPATLNADEALLAAALGPRTKAVCLAHTLGNPFAAEPIVSFCRKHDLWLVEDNCDALGSLYRGRLTGTFGHIATSSFYPPHHMTMGEGGAVYTDDPRLAAIVKSLRDWGRDCTCPSGVDNRCGRRFSQEFGTLPPGYDHKYVYSRFGYNLKVTEMQAAIGCAQLAKLPGFTRQRRQHHGTLLHRLAPHGDLLRPQQATPGSEPSWFGCLLMLTDEAKAAGLTRDTVVSRLEAAKVQTRMLFAGNVVRQPCFDALRAGRRVDGEGSAYRVVGELTASDRVMNDAFWVGVYPGLSDEMVTYIADQIVAACGR